MALFELKQEDINDALALIRNTNLTIRGSDALRVAQLQAILASAQPSGEVVRLKEIIAKLEKELSAAIAAVNASELDARIAKRRLDEGCIKVAPIC